MKQNEKLLSILSGKIKEQFDKFLEALDKTGQQRVRNHITGRKRHHKGAYLQNWTKQERIPFSLKANENIKR